MNSEKENSAALLEQIKNLTLNYNQKVTPRRQVTLKKPENVLSVLLTNSKFYNFIGFIQDR